MFWHSGDTYRIYFPYDRGIDRAVLTELERQGVALPSREFYFYRHPRPAYPNDFVRVLPHQKHADWKMAAATGPMFGCATLKLESWRAKELDAELAASATKRKLDSTESAAAPGAPELEQKFQILRSPSQEQVDFVSFCEDAGFEAYELALVFLDIDNFKQLNTLYTEVVVDRDILGPFQALLRNLCWHRATAYRHGGEEFLLMVPNHTIEEGVAFAERIRFAISRHPFTAGEDDVQLTISAGVAAWPTHGHDLTSVMEAANLAEHKAKAAGRDRVEAAAVAASET
jgi:diguanylate cyclase (GGDEF)-like protein